MEMNQETLERMRQMRRYGKKLSGALGYETCQKGLKVLYTSTNRLMGQLKDTGKGLV